MQDLCLFRVFKVLERGVGETAMTNCGVVFAQRSAGINSICGGKGLETMGLKFALRPQIFEEIVQLGIRTLF